MKQIRIKRLWYQNFRGQSRDLEFGRRNFVMGRNRTGKSTCINVILMLLTDADNTDRTKFGLFDDTRDAERHEDAQTCVYGAEFDINGVSVKLQKSASQKWTRARGVEEYTKAATDDYKYFIDDVEVSASKYLDFVASNFAPVGKLKMMLNIDLWRSLDWNALRRHFGDIVGEITPDDFTGDYTDVLADILACGAQGAKDKYHKLISNSDRSNPGYNEQIRDTEADIDARKDALPDLGGIAAAEEKIAEYNNELAAIDDKILGLQGCNDDARAKRKAEEEAIAVVEREMEDVRRELEGKRNKLKDDRDRCYNVNKQNALQRDALRKNIDSCKEILEIQQRNREDKLKELEDVSLRQFDGHCPFCGTMLEGDMKTQQIDKFVAKRDGDRAAIIAQGKAIKAKIDECTGRIKTMEEQLSSIKDLDAARLEKDLLALPRWESTKEYAEMTAKIESMRASLTPMQDNPDVTDLLTRKGDIMAQLREMYEVTAQKKTHETLSAQIEQLRNRLKSLVAAKAECERKELLCAQYQDEEADIIRKRTNKYFTDDVEVVMQKRKKDGSYMPCCELRICGVNGINAGHERWMRIGVVIAKAFMAYYDVSLPLLIDDVEGIDTERIPDYDGQTIMARWADMDFCVMSK